VWPKQQSIKINEYADSPKQTLVDDENYKSSNASDENSQIVES
jgi:hypothetical protein